MASVIDFLNANSHVNSITGCQIWDGDMDRGGNPIFDMGGQKMSVRALVFASENGPQPARTKYTTTCENVRCVKLAHVDARLPAHKQIEHDPSVVAAVRDLFFIAGKRQDVVATELGLSQPQVSKIVSYIRKQDGVS